VTTSTAELCDVDLSEVEDVVGPRAFERGRAYARRGRALKLRWDPGTATLSGSVVGHGGLYTTVAYFDDGSDGALELQEGECSCPVGRDCKHVAAIVIAAANGRPTQRGSEPASRDEPPAWEQPLRALVEAPAAASVGDPLAIELALQVNGLAGARAPRLVARLMRPGARGGWINGSLTWHGLEYSSSREHRPDHGSLVRELHAAQRARRTGIYYSYGSEKTLDLSDCGPQLWSLLDEAARIGLPLIHAGQGMGELPPYRRGEVAIDVTRAADGHAQVRALLHIDGDDAEGFAPVLFLGADGHGVVCAEAGAGLDVAQRRLLLVRLARAAPAALQRLLLHAEPLAIPASELERFAADICPALQRVAGVVSSDGSFEPPAVSAPRLALRARYRERHSQPSSTAWRSR
jgi:hypothetical protein